MCTYVQKEMRRCTVPEAGRVLVSVGKTMTQGVYMCIECFVDGVAKCRCCCRTLLNTTIHKRSCKQTTRNFNTFNSASLSPPCSVIYTCRLVRLREHVILTPKTITGVAVAGVVHKLCENDHHRVPNIPLSARILQPRWCAGARAIQIKSVRLLSWASRRTALTTR